MRIRQGVSLSPDATVGGQDLMDHLDQYKSSVLGKGVQGAHRSYSSPDDTCVGMPNCSGRAGDAIDYPPLEERAGVRKTPTLKKLFQLQKAMNTFQFTRSSAHTSILNAT